MMGSWYSQIPLYGQPLITDSLLCPWGKKALYIVSNQPTVSAGNFCAPLIGRINRRLTVYINQFVGCHLESSSYRRGSGVGGGAPSGQIYEGQINLRYFSRNCRNPLQCDYSNCNRGYLDKVDRSDNRKVTMHSKKVCRLGQSAARKKSVRYSKYQT